MATRVPPGLLDGARSDVGGLSWIGYTTAHLVHLGQTSAVLEAGGSLVPVTHPATGLMPGGVCLGTATQFGRLRSILSGATDSRVAGWCGWAGGTRVDLGLSAAPAAAEAVDRLHVALALEPVPGPTWLVGQVRRLRASAPDIARLACRLDSRLDVAVSSVIGAGPGSTPTGDDVLVGVLAGLRLSDRGHAVRHLSSVVVRHLSGTTRTGAHFLLAATQNRFAEHVHHAARAVCDRASVVPVIAQCRGWGATSGIDLLSGLAAAIPNPQEEAA